MQKFITVPVVLILLSSSDQLDELNQCLQLTNSMKLCPHKGTALSPRASVSTSRKSLVLAQLYQIARASRTSRASRVTRLFRASDGVHIVVAPTYAIPWAVVSRNSQRP